MKQFNQVIIFVLTFLLIPVVLAGVAYMHIPPLFTGEWTQHLGSIEVSYIQMAKFIESSWPQVSWQPRWYFGYPMELLYTPFVPYFEIFSSKLFGWSFSHSYRVLTALGYVGAIVSVYFLGKTLFKNTVSGLLSALSYAILPSIISLLYVDVATDRFLINSIEPRRFTILVRWGEGPHMVSLVFLPIAGALLVHFLRRGNKLSLLCGVIMTALVALTNSVGAWGFVLLALSIFLGELIEKKETWQTVFLRFVAFGLFAFGFAAFWFNPLFLSSFFREGGGAIGYWKSVFPWGWLLVGGGLTIFFIGAKKTIARFSGLSAALIFFSIMFGLVYTYYASGEDRLELVPQVLRLTTEVDLGLSLLIGMIPAVIGYFLVKRPWVYSVVMIVIAIGGSGAFVTRQMQLAQELPQFTQPLETTDRKLSDTPEYKIAKKIEEKVAGGERVVMPGNYGFYFNYFTDVPQLRGALFQSSIHQWPDHIYYQLTNGKDGNISQAWLKATNTGWLVFSGPLEVYRDFNVGESKFADTLEFDEEFQADKIYKVPLKNNSLAKVVPATFKDIKTPNNAIDSEPLYQYVEQLEVLDTQATVAEKENGTYEITAEIGEDELVLFQMAHAPGWRAKDQTGRSVEIKKDPLGFMLLTPKEAGEQRITLMHGKTLKTWFGWGMTIVTMGIMVFVLVRFKSPVLTYTAQKKKTAADDEE